MAKKNKVARFFNGLLAAIPAALGAIGQPKGLRWLAIAKAVQAFKKGWDEELPPSAPPDETLEPAKKDTQAPK